MPIFEPPIAYDLPPTLPGGGKINSHAKWKKGQRRGRSVLKKNGIYTIVDVPTTTQTLDADIYYAGGHIYEISLEEYYDLIAAGFSPVLGIPGAILLETSTDALATQDGEPITDELGEPIDSGVISSILSKDALLDESGNRLITEYA